MITICDQSGNMTYIDFDIFYDSPLRAYPKLQAADAMRYNKMSILTISFPMKIRISVINENLKKIISLVHFSTHMI